MFAMLLGGGAGHRGLRYYVNALLDAHDVADRPGCSLPWECRPQSLVAVVRGAKVRLCSGGRPQKDLKSA